MVCPSPQASNIHRPMAQFCRVDWLKHQRVCYCPTTLIGDSDPAIGVLCNPPIGRFRPQGPAHRPPPCKTVVHSPFDRRCPVLPTRSACTSLCSLSCMHYRDRLMLQNSGKDERSRPVPIATISNGVRRVSMTVRLRRCQEPMHTPCLLWTYRGIIIVLFLLSPCCRLNPNPCAEIRQLRLCDSKCMCVVCLARVPHVD